MEARVIRQWSIFGWLLMTIFAAPLLAQEVFDPIDAMDDDEQTGLEVGARIPDFRAIDQNGKAWDFDALERSERRGLSVSPLCRLVTVLQNPARGAGKCFR